MTLRKVLGDDGRRVHQQVNDTLDREDAFIRALRRRAAGELLRRIRSLSLSAGAADR